ncbi:MAG: DUF1499 domain-containing protein [Pseudorhodobacter sp.]|nr:DUF1499 domain-containing protein [Pseudorhodobacter sp.]
MKPATYAVAALPVLAFAAFAVWVRVAPSDPAVWNIPVADSTPPTPGPCADKVVQVPRGARVTCLLPAVPEKVLSDLNGVASAADRTEVLAGTPEAGRMTWISRSRIMSFPDYITAEVSPTKGGTRLDILSRQRFGSKDMGVNAARLRQWLAAL